MPGRREAVVGHHSADRGTDDAVAFRPGADLLTLTPADGIA
jgi:hypothetical protein